MLDIKMTFLRGSLTGLIVGIIPGAGATVASFLSYGIESQYGKRRHLLGTGIPEGIVAPQTAATASVGGAIIPLVTMGIPGSGARPRSSWAPFCSTACSPARKCFSLQAISCTRCSRRSSPASSSCA
jgi:hypothetical protein